MRLLVSAPRCRCRLNSNVRLHTKHPTPRLQCRGFLTVLTTQSCHSNAAQERGDCHHRVVLAQQLDGPSNCSAWWTQTLQLRLPSWLSKLKVSARSGVALSACSRGQNPCLWRAPQTRSTATALVHRQHVGKNGAHANVLRLPWPSGAA